MHSTAQSIPAAEAAQQRSATMKTTLYELIEAISEELQPGEDQLLPEIVVHLFDTGKVKFIGNLKEIKKAIEGLTDDEKNEFCSAAVTDFSEEFSAERGCYRDFENETPYLHLPGTL